MLWFIWWITEEIKFSITNSTLGTLEVVFLLLSRTVCMPWYLSKIAWQTSYHPHTFDKIMPNTTAVLSLQTKPWSHLSMSFSAMCEDYWWRHLDCTHPMAQNFHWFFLLQAVPQEILPFLLSGDNVHQCMRKYLLHCAQEKIFTSTSKQLQNCTAVPIQYRAIEC